MFDDPEYASYIQLCRELRLERKPEVGDYFADFWAGFTEWKINLVSANFRTGMILANFSLPDLHEAGGAVWLPRLDQWLAMLESEGYEVVTLRKSTKMDAAREHYIGVVFAAVVPERPDIEQRVYVPTREEAAARLWMAVTGRSGDA